jgi:UDP-N-acetylglucosamine:LPS N-acetylglucosamine transferase
MGGGLGLLPENMEFYNALALLPNVEITLICGNNHSLFKLLSGKYRNINVLGYINNVCDYMKQADVIITKPGGITTFEAIHAEVPILALNPFMQQEMYNAQYIQEMQIGTVINGNANQCVEDIANILDCNQLEFYKNNIRKIKEQLVGNNITQVLMNVIYRSNYTASYNFTNSYKLKSEGRKKHEKISFNL